jgi:hypothetical protein
MLLYCYFELATWKDRVVFNSPLRTLNDGGINMDEDQVVEQTEEPVQGTEPESQEQVSETQEQQEKVFRQADVDRIINERLGRERQKYTPYQSFVDSEAKRNNMTTEQYFQAVEQQRQVEERQQYEAQGINPDVMNQFLEKHPDIQYAKEMRSKADADAKFQSEASEFFSTFPDVEVAKISPEVYQLKHEKGLSLTDAYLRVNFKSLKAQSEQEVIKKLQGNAQSSPGSLGQGGAAQTSTVSSMSKADFKAMQEQVLRGERRQL